MNSLGVFGEAVAYKYLTSKFYKILFTNYSKPRWGEIDIIALDGNEIVFIEVKTRSTAQYGDPLEAVTFYKQRSLKRSINYFLMHEGCEYAEFPQRLDIIGITVDAKLNKVIKLDHVTATT